MHRLIRLLLLPFATVLAPAQTTSTTTPVEQPATGTPAGADAAEPIPLEKQFPFVIKVSTSSAGGFRRGDKIAITTVRSDRKKIQPGGTYLVQGTYTLASAATGQLSLSLTTVGAGRRTAGQKNSTYKIERGSGTFSLISTMQDDGDYHVSFYLPDGEKAPSSKNKSKGSETAPATGPKREMLYSAGGIYFN